MPQPNEDDALGMSRRSHEAEHESQKWREPGDEWVGRIVLIVLLVVLFLLGWLVLMPAIVGARVQGYVEKAQEYYESGDAEAALATYDLILRKYPQTDAAQIARARKADLTPYVREAVARKVEADEFYKNREYKEAWRMYSEIVKEFPHSRQAGYAARTRVSAARHACRRQEAVAEKAIQNHEWERARDIYRAILEMMPDYPNAESRLAEVSSKIERYDEAMENGRAALKREAWRAAQGWFELALEITPQSDEAYAGRTEAVVQIPPPEGMALLVPGWFAAGRMGGDADEPENRKVRLDGLYMDIHEVTNEEYAEFVLATGAVAPPLWTGRRPAEEIRDKPVVGITWHQANAYADWVGKRLPTAIEWERAARGRDGRAYPWGEMFDNDRGVFSGGLRPVGATSADRSPEGIFDLAGNVCEWTASNLDGRRVIKGDSWAGLSLDRENRVVARDIAERPGDPTQMVLVDHPEAWGVLVSGLKETRFFLSGSAQGRPVIKVQRYVPSLNQYVAASFVVDEGEEIGSMRSVRVSGEEGLRHLDVDFSTGSRVVEVINPTDPKEIEVVVENAEGQRRRLPLRFNAPDPPPCEPSDEARAEWFNRVVSDLRGYRLHNLVHAANLRSAPPDAAFVNVGFRCAMDISPAPVPETD